MKGWHRDNYRHSLAARGYKVGNRLSMLPKDITFFKPSVMYVSGPIKTSPDSPKVEARAMMDNPPRYTGVPYNFYADQPVKEIKDVVKDIDNTQLNKDSFYIFGVPYDELSEEQKKMLVDINNYEHFPNKAVLLQHFLTELSRKDLAEFSRKELIKRDNKGDNQ